MKKLFTFMFASLMLLVGTTMANAQSKIPGELDLSTATVDAGTGTLHGSAGWNGSIIDWMTKGNTATIQFENTKADTQYNIISYGGTNLLSAFFAVGTILSVGIRACRTSRHMARERQ